MSDLYSYYSRYNDTEKPLRVGRDNIITSYVFQIEIALDGILKHFIID